MEITQQARNILKRLSADDLDLLSNEVRNELGRDKGYVLNDAAAIIRELNAELLAAEEEAGG